MDMPWILVKDGIISDVNRLFLELSCFSSEDLIHKPFSFVWKDLLRISVEPGLINGDQTAYLFTKSLKAIPVNIRVEIQRESNSILYTFIEDPQASFDNKFLFIEHLYFESKTGVAIYSAPDGTLLKANQVLLNFFDKPYNKAGNSIGRNFASITSGFKGSMVKENWYNAIKTGKVFEVKEIPCEGSSSGTSYWKMMFVPIYEEGILKYLIHTADEITQIVNDRKTMEKQVDVIRQQKEELEAIIENFDDAIFIYDKDNYLYMQNKAARGYFPKALEKYEDIYADTKYYYFDDREIPREKMTNYKVRRGQIVKGDRIKLVQVNNIRYIDVCGRPLFNSDNNIRLSIIHSRDITEEVKKERIIREQQELLLKGEREKQEALKATMELKDEFLYLITHEFRTPIAVISSALQAIELMHKEEINEKVGNYLKMIKQNTNRQLRLVNNLLDITRINSGSIKMNMSSFDIVHVVQTIVNSVKLYGQQKGVNLSLNSTLEKKDIFSDEEKIERILLNLLANALKFTSCEKSIYVTLSEKEQGNRRMISISVEDEGIGIPEEKQKVIFERFGQVDSSLSRNAEGTGLGLHLVKLLVNALDGELILTSEVDIGSTFTVLLPINEPTASGNETTGNETNSKSMYSNDRIIESVVIEFSDIYL